MRPLIIFEETKRDMQRLRAHAEANPLVLSELKRRFESKEGIGDDPQFSCRIPVGFKVVFSIEQQPPPLGLCRHISISVEQPGRSPHFEAVNMIMAEFGMEGPVQTLKAPSMVYREDLPGGRSAINVIIQVPELSPE